ncbi:MAG: FliI/YscN family ATPase [Myxococcales bacterium]|nr:FliI/YscN family ATPase [Myxococcales bacterium]
MLDLEACQRVLNVEDMRVGGRLTHVTGSTLEAILPRAKTGSIYRVVSQGTSIDLLAEVIGFREQETILAPFGELRGISPGDPVIPVGHTDQQDLCESYLGRVIDALGEPIDDGPAIISTHKAPLYRPPPNPLDRRPIQHPLYTGISALDAMTTFGQGQRVGIFSGAGVGKSTLLGMLSRFCTADVNVIALVGERGREVRNFIENELGPEGLKKSVVIVATGDTAPILRLRAAFLATTLAEYFRDNGRHTLLVMDSLTRLAHAVREIGLAAGEPPTTRGYPPSVFSMMPKLLERAGNSGSSGSITAFYTVLVDGDDMTEPIADAARSILDGHVILSRQLAESGHYPAINVSASLSRIAADVIDDEHKQLAARVRQIFAGYEEVRDLIQVGAYRVGTDPSIDKIVQLYPRITDYLRQDGMEKRDVQTTLGGLEALLGPDTHAKTHIQ